MKTRRLVAGLASLAALLALSAAADASDRTKVRVGATVMPRVQFDVRHQVDRLRISEEDARRGYVEVADALRFGIRTNCDYRLEVHVAPGQVVSGEARVLGHGLQIRDGNAAIHLPMSQHATEATVTYRFTLASGTRAGSYEWPARMVLQPVPA